MRVERVRKRAISRSSSWLSSTMNVRPRATIARRTLAQAPIALADRAPEPDAEPDGQHVEQRAVVPAADAEPLEAAAVAGAQPVAQRRRQRRFAAAARAHQREPGVESGPARGRQRAELGCAAVERLGLRGKRHAGCVPRPEPRSQLPRSEGMKPSSSIGKRSSSLLRSSSPTRPSSSRARASRTRASASATDEPRTTAFDERNAVPVHGQLAETQADEDPGQERVAGHVATDGDRRARRPRHVDQRLQTCAARRRATAGGGARRRRSHDRPQTRTGSDRWCRR